MIFEGSTSYNLNSIYFKMVLPTSSWECQAKPQFSFNSMEVSSQITPYTLRVHVHKQRVLRPNHDNHSRYRRPEFSLFWHLDTQENMRHAAVPA